MVLSEVVAADTLFRYGVGGGMVTAPHYTTMQCDATA